MLDQKLHVFIAVTETGSVTKAALRMGLSPSVISFHLDNLEKDLGVPLFSRRGRNLSLTEEGAFFYQHAAKLQKEALATRRKLSQFSQSITRRIRLAGDTLTCTYRMPYALAMFKQKINDVQFFYHDTPAEAAVEQVLAEEIDLAFVGTRVRNKKLNVQVCYQDTVVLVGSLRQGAAPDGIQAVDIPRYPLLWYNADAGLEQTLRKGLAKAGLHPNKLTIFMETDNMPVLLNFVKAGMGYAFLPLATVEEDLKTGVLTRVQVRGVSLTHVSYRVSLKTLEHNPLLKQFVEFLAHYNARAGCENC